jgi:hypothetical protein
MSNTFIQNEVKHGDSLSSLIYSCALEYDGKKIQECKKGMELTAAHQLLIHDDDVYKEKTKLC